MANEKKKPVKIVETVLRDAHQSLIATRMTTEHEAAGKRFPTHQAACAHL